MGAQEAAVGKLDSPDASRLKHALSQGVTTGRCDEDTSRSFLAHELLERGGVQQILAVLATASEPESVHTLQLLTALVKSDCASSTTTFDDAFVEVVRLLREGPSPLVKLTAAEATVALIEASPSNAAMALKLRVHETLIWLLGAGVDMMIMKLLIIKLMRAVHHDAEPAAATTALQWMLRSFTDTARMDPGDSGAAAFEVLCGLFQDPWFIGAAIDAGTLGAYNATIEQAVHDEEAENRRPFLHCMGLVAPIAESEHCAKLVSKGIAASLTALQFVSTVPSTQSSVSAVLRMIASKGAQILEANPPDALPCLERIAVNPIACARIAKPKVIAACVSALRSANPERIRLALTILIKVLELPKTAIPRAHLDERGESDGDQTAIRDEDTDEEGSSPASQLVTSGGIQQLLALFDTSMPEEKIQITTIWTALAKTGSTFKRKLSVSLEALVKATSHGDPYARHASAVATLAVLEDSNHNTAIAIDLRAHDAFLSLLPLKLDATVLAPLFIALLKSLQSLATPAAASATTLTVKSLIDLALTDRDTLGTSAWVLLLNLFDSPFAVEIGMDGGLLDACNNALDRAVRDNSNLVATQPVLNSLRLLARISMSDQCARRVAKVCGSSVIACLKVATESFLRLETAGLLIAVARSIEGESEELVVFQEGLSELLAMIESGDIKPNAAGATVLALLVQKTPSVAASLPLQKLLDLCQLMMGEGNSEETHIAAIELITALAANINTGQTVVRSEPVIEQLVSLLSQGEVDNLVCVFQAITALAGYADGRAILMRLCVPETLQNFQLFLSQMLEDIDSDDDDDGEEREANEEMTVALVRAQTALQTGAS